MSLAVWGIFFLKMFVLFAGVYVLIILTPKLAAYIDRRRKQGSEPKAPRPERVEDNEAIESHADKDDDK